MNEAQKDMSRRRQQRYRESQKRNATVTPERNVTDKSVTRNATPIIEDLPANFGQDDCECRHCRNNRAKGSPHTLNHGPHKLAGALSKNELNRVALPGDVDYKGAA